MGGMGGYPGGHGERSRLQLLFELAGTENLLILAVDVLAGNFWLLISNFAVPVSLRAFQAAFGALQIGLQSVVYFSRLKRPGH